VTVFCTTLCVFAAPKCAFGSATEIMRRPVIAAAHTSWFATAAE